MGHRKLQVDTAEDLYIFHLAQIVMNCWMLITLIETR